jgi:hypothetical protein
VHTDKVRVRLVDDDSGGDDVEVRPAPQFETDAAGKPLEPAQE